MGKVKARRWTAWYKDLQVSPHPRRLENVAIRDRDRWNIQHPDKTAEVKEVEGERANQRRVS